MSKSRKNKKNKRLGIILVLEVVVFIGLILGYAWYFVNHTLDQIPTDEVKKEEIDVSAAVTETMKEKYMSIALFGVDTRDEVDLTKEGAARSDAIIIASINNETKEVKLVSVYRDCFVEMMKDEVPSTLKATEVYYYGGPAIALETLNRNLDMNIQNYVTVDFKALTNAIDALGGVTINVKESEINNLNNNLQEQIGATGIQSEGVWEAGEQVLNGSQATAYARIRKVGNNDFERTQRQRAVITAMIDQAKKSDLQTITNVINEVFSQIATNLTKKELLSLAAGMFEYELTENTGFPLSHQTPDLGSKGSVVVPANLLSNVEYLHEFLFPEDTDYIPSAEVQQISTNIMNETGIGDEFTDDKKTEEPTATNAGDSTEEMTTVSPY